MLMGIFKRAVYLASGGGLERRVGERLVKGWGRVGEGLGSCWGGVGELLGRGWGRVGESLAYFRDPVWKPPSMFPRWKASTEIHLILSKHWGLKGSLCHWP